MKVLVACEESQTVCKAFRERGHEAYSCDIQEPSGGHPEWHILGDATAALDGGVITTMDGKQHDVGKWDLMIAYPPCTYLTVTGNRWLIFHGMARKRFSVIKTVKMLLISLCGSLNATYQKLLLRTLLAICQQRTKNQLKLFILICLVTLQERQLVYG